MRLFVSIPMNHQMKHSLVELQKEMVRKGYRGNYTRRDNLHMTVAFIGDFEDLSDKRWLRQAVFFGEEPLGDGKRDGDFAQRLPLFHFIIFCRDKFQHLLLMYAARRENMPTKR